MEYHYNEYSTNFESVPMGSVIKPDRSKYKAKCSADNILDVGCNNVLQDKRLWLFVIFTGIIAIIAWVAGAGFLNGDWWNELNKPDWMPPTYVIFTIWFVMYLFIAFLGYYGSRLARTHSERNLLNLLFLTQLGLNLTWIIILFNYQNIQAAFWIAIFLMLFIIFWLLYLSKINSNVSLIGIIYAIWIIFIIVFNWQLVIMN